MKKVLLVLMLLMSSLVLAYDSSGGCVDSDGGKDVYEKGRVTDKDGDVAPYEYCKDATIVQESWCADNGYEATSFIGCPSGYSCSNGACTKSTQGCTNPSAQHGKFKCVLENSISKVYMCDNGLWNWINTCGNTQQCLSSLGDSMHLCGVKQDCEETSRWVCEGNTKVYYQYNSDCVLSKSQSEQCSGVCKDGSCVVEKCTAGQTKTYLCPDGKQVNWCSCVNGEWSCIPSPESACSVECTSNSNCDKGYTCKDGQCEGGVPVFVWYIIGALVLIAGFIIYWFGSWRKK